MLTHAQTHALDSNSGYGGEEDDGNTMLTSFDTLQFLKSKLTEAEVANRHAHHDTVFAAYEDIAKHYQSQHDFKTAVYFLTKALGVAQLAQDSVREAQANEALGLAKEKMGAIRQAIQYYETHRDLLVRHGLEVPGESARHVIRAYKALAEEVQRQGDYQEAITYLEKSLEASQALNDRVAEGVSVKLLGNAYSMQGQYDKAIECFHIFLRICQETDDKLSEGAACSALASAYEAKGDRGGSIKYLELFYEIAHTTGELTAQREACARLGIIFNSASNYQVENPHFICVEYLLIPGQLLCFLFSVWKLNLSPKIRTRSTTFPRPLKSRARWATKRYAYAPLFQPPAAPPSLRVPASSASVHECCR